MIHELKAWPQYFRALATGEKTFEVRKNDRNYQVEDRLHIREWNPLHNTYTGLELEFKISYLLPGGAFGIEEGFVVLGLYRHPQYILPKMELPILDRVEELSKTWPDLIPLQEPETRGVYTLCIPYVTAMLEITRAAESLTAHGLPAEVYREVRTIRQALEKFKEGK